MYEQPVLCLKLVRGAFEWLLSDLVVCKAPGCFHYLPLSRSEWMRHIGRSEHSSAVFKFAAADVAQLFGRAGVETRVRGGATAT